MVRFWGFSKAVLCLGLVVGLSSCFRSKLAWENDLTLTADSAAPTFSGLASATAPGPSQIDLGWALATDDQTASSSIYYTVYVSVTSGAQNFSSPTSITAAGATTHSITGLLPNTTYYVVVRAKDLAGNEDTNAVERNVTTSPDTMPPTFSGVSGISSGANTITLSWSAASDNITPTSGMTYLIYQATTSGGQSFGTPTATVSGGALSWTSSALLQGQTYYYVVRARDGASNTETNVVELSQFMADTQAPTFAGLTSATGMGSGSVQLNWSSATDNVTAAGSLLYDIYFSTTSGTQNFGSASYVSAAGATSYVATGLTQGVTYYFVVRARDAAGNRDTNTVQFTAAPLDTTAPIFSGVSVATGNAPSSIDLSWSPASDNVTATGSIIYDIYQANSSGGQNFTVPSYSTGPGATSYTVTSLLAGIPYYFVVRARDVAGNRDTNTVERTATIVDPTAPTFAGLTSAVAITTTSVLLTWSPATDVVTPQGSIVYDIYPASSSGGQNFVTPDSTTAPGATSAVVSGLPAGMTFYFVVRARDTDGNRDANTVERIAATLPTPTGMLVYTSRASTVSEGSSSDYLTQSSGFAGSWGYTIANSDMITITTSGATARLYGMTLGDYYSGPNTFTFTMYVISGPATSGTVLASRIFNGVPVKTGTGQTMFLFTNPVVLTPGTYTVGFAWPSGNSNGMTLHQPSGYSRSSSVVTGSGGTLTVTYGNAVFDGPGELGASNMTDSNFGQVNSLLWDL
ncbi:MAG: hypothetical protein JNL01_15535 [Bdellovibrionales bacterium]|nr:hypothetical protein [Bdellovibrionales bacterium]